MVIVYSKEFLDEYEVIDTSYREGKNPHAKQERDSYARELRKAGWEVTTKKFSFQDFGFSNSYLLFAKRKKIVQERKPEKTGYISTDTRGNNMKNDVKITNRQIKRLAVIA